jgi:hypothetical protein
MRMITATILALLPLTFAAAHTNPARPANIATAPAKCDRFGRVEQIDALPRTPPRAQRLGELPPGDLHLTVDRRVNGCHQPAIVRENIGGASFRGR